MSMVRFRVVKAAHLAVALAALLLVGVIVALAIRYVSSAGDATPVGSFVSEAAESAASPMTMQIELLPEWALADGGTAENRMEGEYSGAEADAAMAVSAVPSVLIYHTHTHEAYRQSEDDPYEEAGGPWRTVDGDHNVVRVGDALADALAQRGIRVEHDETDYEQDDFETAYVRSLRALQQREQAFDLYIDLHRDAYESGSGATETLRVGQKQLARLMLIVGTGENSDDRPDSAGNYRFAVQLTERINAATPGLCRDVMVKPGRYNQQVGRSILVEAGCNRNTLQEALNAMPCLADALAELLTAGESAQAAQ